VLAVKTEKRESKDYLSVEAEIYQLLSGAKGFPKCFWHGATRCIFPDSQESWKCNVLVMSLLSPSLSDLFYKTGKRFSLKTVLMIGTQMIDRLAALHNAGIVHRDVKPGNFVMGSIGSASSNEVHLIDFGLAHRYRDLLNRHVEFREGVPFRGTHRYASVTSHFRVEQTRRDDLEALGYVLIYFLKGMLPWQSLSVMKSDRRVVIGDMKKKTSTSSLTMGLPDTFSIFLDYTKGLHYNEDPDYDYLKCLLLECMKKNQFHFDYMYDWLVKPCTPFSNTAADVVVLSDDEPDVGVLKRKATDEKGDQPKRRKVDSPKDETDNQVFESTLDSDKKVDSIGSRVRSLRRSPVQEKMTSGKFKK